MSTAVDPVSPMAKMNFPGPVAGKRRRMRSGGNVSTLTNNAPKGGGSAANTTQQQSPPSDIVGGENISEEKTAQTSKCKGATTIPIFLKKTYKMIDTCDSTIASWTEDGDMFVVKDPDLFATHVIPQYFDHNKFSSFARQLNFYGFRKMQSKPIRNSDYDAGTAKHVTFYNENFKRGRCDLLKKIQRSTRGGTTNTQDHQRDIQVLRDHLSALEQKITDMAAQSEERIRRLELDMLERMEQMMLTVQRQQTAQMQLQKATSVGSQHSSAGGSTTQRQLTTGSLATWDPTAYNFARTSSVASANNNSYASAPVPGSLFSQQQHQQTPPSVVPPSFSTKPPQRIVPPPYNNGKPPSGAGATLEPHPHTKKLFPGPLGGSMGPPPEKGAARGLSQLTLSNLSRGQSMESTTSAMLMDNYFATIMLDGDSKNANGANHSNGGSSGLGGGGPGVHLSNVGQGPVTVSNGSSELAPHHEHLREETSDDHDDLSSVSSGEMD